MQTIRILLLCMTICIAASCPPAPRQYTIRHPDMTTTEFVTKARQHFKERAPEWYSDDLLLEPDWDDYKHYALTWTDASGRIRTSLGYGSLTLATVEDLTSILLHEAVHIKEWDHIFDPSRKETEECRKAQGEVSANRVAIAYYDQIGYTPEFLGSHSRALAKHQLLIEEHCPKDTETP